VNNCAHLPPHTPSYGRPESQDCHRTDASSTSSTPSGRLAAIRREYSDTVDSEALVVAPWVSGQTRWWTGPAPEPTTSSPRHLSSVRPGLVDELDRYDNRYIKLRAEATVGEVREALRAARDAHGEDLERVEAPVSEDAPTGGEAVQRAEYLALQLWSYLQGIR